MRTLIVLAFALFLSSDIPAYVADSQARAITLMTRFDPPAQQTNEFTIEPYEVAKLVSYPAASRNHTVLEFTKDRSTLVLLGGSASVNDHQGRYEDIVIAGPATIRLRRASVYAANSFCTFQVLPVAFPPNHSLILEPSTNKTSITLESSTNLVHWGPATNGVYGSPAEAKFFRIKAERIQ